MYTQTALEPHMRPLAHILVVDDNSDIRSMLQSFLSHENYRVEVAADAEQALKLYAENKFDIILCDVIMPGMNGIDLLKHIRSRDQETAFVMLSGYPDINKAVEAMREGAYDYVTKPFNLQDVKLRIARALENKTLHMRIKSFQGISWAFFLSIPVWLILIIIILYLLRQSS